MATRGRRSYSGSAAKRARRTLRGENAVLDLIVVNHNTARMTAECLASLVRHTETPYRLIVVDNASTDGSPAFLASRFPQATILVNAVNEGYGKACNAGARAGEGEHLIFLNSDVLALPGWDRPLLECLESDERIAAVGPKLVTLDGRIAAGGVTGTNAHPVLSHFGEPDQGQCDRRFDAVSLCGAAFMIKRRLIPVLGLFDERYPFYFEETDWCYNAREKGYRLVYCPEAKMIHHLGQTVRKTGKAAAYFQYAERLFKEKWRHVMDDPRYYG